jgi:hypothetical protein
MKPSRMFALFFVIAAALACFAHHMAVVVNKDNHLADVAPAQLARICRLETRKWPDGKDVILVLHRDSAGEMATLEHLTRMSQSELKAFVASHKDTLTLADSDAEVLRIVTTIPGAVGLVDVRSINDQVNVLKVAENFPWKMAICPTRAEGFAAGTNLSLTTCQHHYSPEARFLWRHTRLAIDGGENSRPRKEFHCPPCRLRSSAG